MIALLDCKVIKIERNPFGKNSERLSIHFKDNENNIFILEQIVENLDIGDG